MVSDLLLKLLGAVGAGIGILGFVTFFGGAMLWVRLNEAKLPASEAVAVIPRSVLVTTGATFLAPAVATAAGVVAASLIVYLVFNLGVEKDARKRRNEAKTLAHEAEEIGRRANATALEAKLARMDISVQEEELSRAKEALGQAAGLEDEIRKRGEEARDLEAASLAEATASAETRAQADNVREAAEIKLERSPWQLRFEGAVGFIALLVIPLLSNQTVFHVKLKWWGVILIAALALAAAVSLFVYLETERFVWFGVTAFLTVGIFIGLSTYVSTKNNVKMQPAAVLRRGHAPVYGAFVADTSANLYLGTFRTTGKPPHLLAIPRDQVTELTIGPLMDPRDARNRAIKMALEECAQRVEEAVTDPMPGKKKNACTKHQKEALRNARI